MTHGIPWPEAVRTAAAAAGPLPPLRLPLAGAIGHTLAEDLRALIPVPHYASSAMDGWAVAGPGPWLLGVRGSSGAAPGSDSGALRSSPAALLSGRAVPILTGGLIPDGAEAVLRSEHGAVDPDGAVLRTGAGARPGEPAPGQHIRAAGQEIGAGEVAIPAGTQLNPAHASIAAVCGHDVLAVHPHPTVRLIFTGDEVVTAGIPAPGYVRDSFGPQLGHVVAALGGRVTSELRLPDELDPLAAAIADEAYDVVITTGGTGTSDADHLRAALAGAGAELLVPSIGMRPGHPAILARLPGGRWLVGLPGNPLAAMMAVLTLVEPLLAGFNGRAHVAGRTAPVLSGAELEPLRGRYRLLPCTLTAAGEAVPAEWVGSGMMRGLASADAVLVVPPEGLRRGDRVRLLTLPWRAGG